MKAFVISEGLVTNLLLLDMKETKECDTVLSENKFLIPFQLFFKLLKSCYHVIKTNASNCKYYDLKEIKPLTKLNDKSFLLVSYLNTCSISKHSEDLEYFFDSNNFNFDFINTSETRITKNKSPINNIDLTNYSYKYCPTKCWAGGTPLQFKNLSFLQE